jgi:hypothetical protein
VYTTKPSFRSKHDLSVAVARQEMIEVFLSGRETLLHVLDPNTGTLFVLLNSGERAAVEIRNSSVCRIF